MPTPDRTSLDEIVRAAQHIMEDGGVAGLTMQAVAARVGVRAPSLYKRVQSREELIRLALAATLTELMNRLDAASTLIELANNFRDFGHERPVAFQLGVAPGRYSPTADDAFSAALSAPILRISTRLAGAEHALEAARTLTAWVVGFVMMELNGGFQLTGDVDEAWKFGASRIAQAIAAPESD